jgi:hypothetical protein
MSNTVEIPTLHTPADIAEETAAILGVAPLPNLPPLTAGRLAVLELIGSPFVVATSAPIDPLDVVRALYVLAIGPFAAAPALSASRAIAAIRADTAPTADPAARYAAIASAADGFADFDRAALAWLDQSGIANLDAAAVALVAHFRAAAAGFELIPGSDTAQKKTSNPPPNGSLAFSPSPPPPAPRSRWTRFCGLFRSPPSRTSAPPPSAARA